jgi:trehalose 6-phosphate phosphatase
MCMSKMAAPPRLDPDRWGLFLDYDGTLVELAPTPELAVADAELRALLAGLHGRCRGALAIVSGRPVADIDGFLAPLRLTVAGLHGHAVRRHDGGMVEAAPPEPALHPVRAAFAEFSHRHPGTLVEDKRWTLALHYRQAPGAADAAAALAGELAEQSGGRLRLQRGKMVVELIPAGGDKGSAIAALLASDEFRGRVPVFVGDDLTDEAGFRRVNQLGGISVRIGAGRSDARFGLADVAALRAWLREAVRS